MKKLQHFKNLLLFMLACCINLSTNSLSTAQIIKEPVKCDASFIEDTNLRHEPAIYPPLFYRYFKAVNTGFNLYRWDFGDGSSPDTGIFVKHHFNHPGKYQVTLQVLSKLKGDSFNYCTDAKSQWIEIKSTTVDPYTHSCAAKLGTNVSYNKVTILDSLSIRTLVYDGTDVKRTWYWGDGAVEEGSEFATHVYKTPGQYNITLVKTIIKDPCFPDNLNCKAAPITVCREKFSAVVSVKEIGVPEKCTPVLSFTLNGQQAIFTDLAKVVLEKNDYVSNEWNFGDGSTTSAEGPVRHNYTTPGQYAVTLKKTIWHNPCPGDSNGIACMALPFVKCSTEAKTLIYVDFESRTCEAKIVSAVKGQYIELHDAIDEKPAQGLIYYDWSFGDGSTGTGNYIKHHYTTTGKYHVVVTKSNISSYCPPGTNCLIAPIIHCSKKYEIWVNVDSVDEIKCKANFTTRTEGNKVILRSNITGGEVKFVSISFGNGDFIESNGNTVNTTYTYPKPGTYNICMRVASVPDSILPYVKLAYYCTDSYCQSVTLGNTKALPDSMTVLGTGHNESKMSVSLSPNPAQERIKFHISNGSDKMILRFYDSKGNLVKKIEDVTGNEIEVMIPELESGIYMYSVTGANNSVFNGKLMVIK